MSTNVAPRLPSSIDRRGFLRASGGGAAAVALASLLPAGCAANYPQAAADDVALTALSPKEYAVARAVAEALLVDVPVEAATVAATMDRELTAVGDPVRGDMKTVLALLQHLTFLSGHLRRFTELDVDERLACLSGWGTSRLALRRAVYTAVRGFTHYFAYTRDATRALTRFPGPWPERLSIPAHPVDFGDVV